MNIQTFACIIVVASAANSLAFPIGVDAFSIPLPSVPRSSFMRTTTTTSYRFAFAAEITKLRSTGNNNGEERTNGLVEQNDDTENDNSLQQQPQPTQEQSNFVRGVTTKLKSAASTVRTNLSSTAPDTASNFKSAVGNAWSGASSSTKGARMRCQELVQSVGQTAQTGLTGMGSVVGSVAGSAGSGLVSVVKKGRSDTVAVARTARSGIAVIATRAGSVAGSAGSSLAGAIQQGRTDTVAVVRWLDSQAKDGVSTTNAKARDIVLKFTGKPDYVFGDIAKELIRRASSSDVSIQDILLLLKILLTVGASFTPLAKLLPLTVLLDMMNVSIEARIGGKLLEVLAESLDDRFKAAVTAEELGDLAKRSLVVGITSFTGKERYEEGDIEQAVQELQEQQQQQQQQEDAVQNSPMTSASTTSANSNIPPQYQQRQTTPKTLDLTLGPEFEAWDAAFRENHPGDWESAIETSLNAEQISPKDLDKEIVSELDEWDKQFGELYATDN